MEIEMNFDYVLEFSVDHSPDITRSDTTQNRITRGFNMDPDFVTDVMRFLWRSIFMRQQALWQAVFESDQAAKDCVWIIINFRCFMEQIA